MQGETKMRVHFKRDNEAATVIALDQLIANFYQTGGWQFRHNETDMRDDLAGRGWYEGAHDTGRYLVINLDLMQLEPHPDCREMKSKIETEFPDYPVTDLPPIPAGFVDTSWHNNSAPSFDNAALGLSVWIDYANTAQREHDGGKRFYVHAIEADGAFAADDAILETDDWAAVLALIAAKR